MRRGILFTVVTVLCLLLAGCVVGGVVKPNPNPDPDPGLILDPEPIFDRSPTVLSLEFNRYANVFQGLRNGEQNVDEDNKEAEVAYVYMYCTDKDTPYLGNVVYSVLREIELEEGASTFRLEVEVPAETGYLIKSIVIRGLQFLEVSAPLILNVPANTITSATVQMEQPQYILQLPDKFYSGGSLGQIYASVPEHLAECTYVYVWLGLNPWPKNGQIWHTNEEGEGWMIIGSSSGGFLPEVQEPTKLYYQVGVAPFGDLFPNERPWPYMYDPDLDTEEELPYIWIYP